MKFQVISQSYSHTDKKTIPQLTLIKNTSEIWALSFITLSTFVNLHETYISMRSLSTRFKFKKNSIRDARTPQPGEIVFMGMRYRSSETVQRSGYFQSSVSYIKVKMMFK